MKYIRTEDELGIYVEYDGEYKDLNEGTYFKTWRGFSIHEDWKVADTIEKLCDEAVFFDEDNKPRYKSQEGNVWYLGAGLFTKTLRFGIFTDKGLIYVAKMNEKGELELL